MTKEPYTITNQKLYFAKLTLDNWRIIEDSPEFNKALLKKYQEETITHLYFALWATYNEIANFYRFPLLAHTPILSDFLTEAFIEQYSCPELKELATLLVTSNSVVASINNAWADLFNPLFQNQAVSTHIISTKQLDAGLSRENLDSNLQELTELIRHFRAGLTEY